MTTLARHVGEIVERTERADRATEFAKLARFVLLRGSVERSAGYLENKSSSEGMLGPKLYEIIKAGSAGIGVSYFKSAVPPLTSSALADYSGISSAFIGGLANAAFDQMLPSMHRVPNTTGTGGNITLNAQAYYLSEAGLKPITRESVANTLINPQKAVGAYITTLELFHYAVPGTLAMLEQNLRNAVTVATDQSFFTSILSGVVVNTSTGVTAEAVRADLSTMLKQITTDAGSKLFIVTTPLICKMWSMASDQKGVSAFPDLSPLGGLVQKIPVLISDGLAVGTVVMLDAGGVAGNGGDVTLVNISESMVQQDSAPDSPPVASTNYESLWQVNKRGIAIERFFVGTKLRSDCIAACLNANSYQSANSPP